MKLPTDSARFHIKKNKLINLIFILKNKKFKKLKIGKAQLEARKVGNKII